MASEDKLAPRATVLRSLGKMVARQDPPSKTLRIGASSATYKTPCRVALAPVTAAVAQQSLVVMGVIRDVPNNAVDKPRAGPVRVAPAREPAAMILSGRSWTGATAVQVISAVASPILKFQQVSKALETAHPDGLEQQEQMAQGVTMRLERCGPRVGLAARRKAVQSARRARVVVAAAQAAVP